jgi:hypothetical protein
MRLLHHTLIAFAISALPILSSWAQQVEYFWDTDPGVGKGQVLQQFTGTEATVRTELDAGDLTVGIHQLGLRVLNDTWYSATYYRSFFVPTAEESITRIEYGWDVAPALGEGQSLSFSKGSTVDLTQTLSVNDLASGMHSLYLRALTESHFSQTYVRSFYIPETPHAVKAIEYFFDNDPGVGKGTQIAASVDGESLTKAFSVDTEGLAAGVHQIGIRTLTDGTWSATKVRQFLVRNVEDGYVAHVEYFWNNDPGLGNGIPISVTPAKEVTLNFEADMRMLTRGIYYLGLRAQSGAGFWGKLLSFPDIEFVGFKGDANGDGIVDIADAVRIINHILGKPTQTFIEANADTNSDGEVDIADAVHIVNFIVGKIEQLAPRKDNSQNNSE